MRHYSDQPEAAVFVLENSNDEKLVWTNAVSKLLTGPKGRWQDFAKDQDDSQISTQKAQEIAGFVTKNELDFAHVVNQMRVASRALNFGWGLAPQSALDGAGKGPAWVDFERDRNQELQYEIRTRMRYMDVLDTYEEGKVFRFRDIGVIDFADKVVRLLTIKEG